MAKVHVAIFCFICLRHGILASNFELHDARWKKHDFQRLHSMRTNHHMKPGHFDETAKCLIDTEIFENITANHTYSKHKIPMVDGMPVTVRIEAWVQAVSAISDITSDFHTDIYISERWYDPRLQFEDKLEYCEKKAMTLNPEQLDKLWTPSTCFINSKAAAIHKSPFRNVWAMLFANGTVWTNYRMSLSGPCEMNLKPFPMDTLECNLTFESYNYNTDEVHLRWIKPNSLGLLNDLKRSWMETKVVGRQTFVPTPAVNAILDLPAIKLADYKLIKMKASEDAVVNFRIFGYAHSSDTKLVILHLDIVPAAKYACSYNPKTAPPFQEYPAGYWDELTMQFFFRRQAGWYILQAYLPTYLTIFISWISFYLGPGIAARTLLGVNALLALTFQFGNIIQNLPRVSYVKAIDVWMLSCITFVFCSLLELAFVAYLASHDNKYAYAMRMQGAAMTGGMGVPTSSGTNRRNAIAQVATVNEKSPLNKRVHLCCDRTVTCTCPSPSWTLETVDKISAVAFPMLFILFNIFYWWYYAYWIHLPA